MATREEVIAALKRKGYNGPIPEQKSQGADLSSIVQAQQPTMRQSIGDAITRLGGGTPAKRETSLSDIASILKIQNLMGQQNQPAPKGYQIGPGGKLVSDPDYINPEKQELLDLQQEKERLAIQKAEDEKRLAGEAEVNKGEALMTQSQSMLDAIGKAEEGSKYFGFGGDWDSIPVVTGDYNKRSTWESNIDYVLKNMTLETINEMRNASRTGATGFGNMTEKELEVLRGAATTLNRRIPEAEARRLLAEMKPIYQKIVGSKTPSGNAGGGKTAEARFSELLAGGSTEDEAYKTLASEGF